VSLLQKRESLLFIFNFFIIIIIIIISARIFSLNFLNNASVFNDFYFQAGPIRFVRAPILLAKINLNNQWGVTTVQKYLIKNFNNHSSQQQYQQQKNNII
jgi:hypothetical protein